MKDTNIEPISQILSGKQISIVCGGGIGSIEMPRVARELRRHGAHVQFVVTQKCLEFVGITSLEWSSQNPVVLEPSGLSEHICTADAVLVAPATADIISKSRHGLCTDGASTLLQSAFGRRIPVGFVPTMHHSMWHSPCIQENCAFLQTLENVFFLTPRQEEHKEKIPPPEQLALTFAHYVNKVLHKDRTPVAITLGGTHTMIDPVRCITNASTGKLGWEAVKLFYGMGHKTTAFVAHTNFDIPKYQDLNLYESPEYLEMFDIMKNFDFNSVDGFFHFLAASDFVPSVMNMKKIKSTEDELTLHLKKTKKIRDLASLKSISYKFFCKLESDPLAPASNPVVKERSLGLLRDDTGQPRHDRAKQRDDAIGSMDDIVQFMNKEKIQSLLWNTPQNAWNKENVHNALFVARNKNEFSFTPISGKKEIVQKIYEDYIK